MIIMDSYYQCMKECRDNFLYLVLVFLLLTRSGAKSSDLENLLSFKSSLPDSNILQNWQQGVNNPCSFTGVSCNSNSRVSSLDLTAFTVSGNFNSVSTHLFSIEQLTSITLKSSNISKPLQPFSSCSPFLARIDLSNNSISGSVSDLSIFGSCSGLKHLNVSSNLLDNSKGLKGANLGLSSLETLDVSANPLLAGKDVLPWVLSEACAHLSHLSMRGNKLGGSFSLARCTHLEYLDLSSNKFSTPLPHLGRDCPSLRYLNLSSNRFYGEFGDAFAGLKSLEFVHLGSNQLQGVVPKSFADETCSTLVELNLSNNNFSGMIPSGFESCSLLETFDVSTNNLSGDSPVEIFLKMRNLKKLVLAFNNFKGTLPYNVSSMSNLEVLDLSSNYISGNIPYGICKSTKNGGGINLKELYLQNNLLTGLIPPSLGNCSQLASLDLSVNYLSGKIPSSLGSLSKLKGLIMWMNQLEGDIPPELMYNHELENFNLDYNKLTGTIPSSLKKCTNLIWISLSSNQLHGMIPSWIGSLDNLAILKLSNNSFNGEIPPELGDCKSLLWLDLRSNKLSGSIPSSLAKRSGFMAVGHVVGKKFVYLSNEGECIGTGNLLEFTGIRLEALDRIPTRKVCSFSRIFLDLPFNHNGSMIFLDLSFNNLDGYIPKELGSMSYLSILNLGHNHLSGPIPTQLGELKYIGVLDLSYNQLSGEIPTSLGGLTLLTKIDLSNNELSGMLPENGQFEIFPPYRFYHNSGLCGYPLPSCDTSLSPQLQLVGDGSSPAKETHESDHDYFYLGLYVSIGFGFWMGFCGFFGTLALKDSWRHRYFGFLEHIIKHAYFWVVQHIINRVYVVVAVQVAKLQRNPKNVANQRKCLRFGLLGIIMCF